jgi:uncharacterized protein (TIGR00251 family)
VAGAGPALIRSTPDGIHIEVRVIPRARTTSLTSFRDEQLVVRVAAPPVEGAANQALTRYLADVLGLPRRAVQIVSGAAASRKRLAITGLSPAAFRQRIEKLLS